MTKNKSSLFWMYMKRDETSVGSKKKKKCESVSSLVFTHTGTDAATLPGVPHKLTWSDRVHYLLLYLFTSLPSHTHSRSAGCKWNSEETHYLRSECDPVPWSCSWTQVCVLKSSSVSSWGIPGKHSFSLSLSHTRTHTLHFLSDAWLLMELPLISSSTNAMQMEPCLLKAFALRQA